MNFSRLTESTARVSTGCGSSHSVPMAEQPEHTSQRHSYEERHLCGLDPLIGVDRLKDRRHDQPRREDHHSENCKHQTGVSSRKGMFGDSGCGACRRPWARLSRCTTTGIALRLCDRCDQSEPWLLLSLKFNTLTELPTHSRGMPARSNRTSSSCRRRSFRPGGPLSAVR